MRVPLPALLLAAALIGGCSNASFAPSGGERLAPYPGPVEVLRRLPPEGSYTMLGVVTVKGAQITGDDAMLARARDVAAEHGADAIVPQAGVRDVVLGGGGDERTLAAYAIRRR